MKTSYILLFTLMGVGTLLALCACSTDRPVSGPIRRGERQFDSRSPRERLTDMSHVFKRGESKEHQAIIDRAAQDAAMRVPYKKADDSFSLSPADLQMEQLIKLVEKRNRVREEIMGLDHQEVRQELVGIATDSLRAAREYQQRDESEESQIANTIADVVLDLASGFTSGVSWGCDIYEAIIGKDLINGGNLSTFSRSVSVIGVITFGFSSHHISKAAKVVGRILKDIHAKDIMDCFRRIIGTKLTAEQVPWGTWGDLNHVTYQGKEYAKIGTALYTKHAIDRMTPLSFDTLIGSSSGRGIPTMVVEHILSEGERVEKQIVANSIVQEVWQIGTIQVITEQEKKIVATVRRVP